MSRRKVIVRVNSEREKALAWLKLIYKIQADDEIYDLAFDQLYQATRQLEEKIRAETPNLVKEMQSEIAETAQRIELPTEEVVCGNEDV